jgi:sortase A
MRALLRFIAAVMTVSGVLLIADAATTLAWQEPVSYVMTQLRQNELESALAQPPDRVRGGKPLNGDAIGKIGLPSLDRSYLVVEGTDTADLRKGPGHYTDTPMPGDDGTVGIAGHRTTNGAPFRSIDRLRRGDEIVVDMTYGRFVYEVEKTRIVDPSEVSVKEPVGYQRLILSACHPLYSAAQRIVVFARLVGRGPSRVSRTAGPSLPRAGTGRATRSTG